MSELLDRAIAQVRTLPVDAQDEVARLLLDWTKDIAPDVDERSVEPIDPEHLAAIEEGLSDARAGRISSTEEVEAAFSLFRTAR